MKIKKDKIFFIISILCLLLIANLFINYIAHTKSIYNTSLKNVYDIVLNVEEDRLKEIINRVIKDIDKERDNKQEECKKLINSLENLTKTNISYQEFSNIYNYLNEKYGSNDLMLITKAIAINTYNNEVIYSSAEEFQVGKTIQPKELDNYKQNSKYSMEHNFKENNVDIVIGIKDEDIENLIKSEILSGIKNNNASQNGYIWIDEIIDFNGGDDYAKRLLHPNIKDGKAKMLSTNYQDSSGKFVYKEMLDGINKDGEILLSYNFKKVESDEQSKKISYLKLYPKYNWVIATGLYIDELETYIYEQRNEYQIQLKTQIITVVGITAILFMIAGIMWWGMFNHFEYKKRQLNEQETEIIKKHYKLIETKYDKSNAIIHDVKNHLISIHGLAVKDNAEEIKEYVKSIQADISQLGYMVVTGNKILDIILSEKMHTMKDNNIEFKHNIENINLDFIEYKDLVTIITNLLDNSIESCVHSSNKKITFSIYSFNNNFIVVKAINSCDNKPIVKDGVLQTSKKNKKYHGYGLNNINKILDRYSGNLKWNYDEVENEFSVVIMIPRNHKN